MGVFSRFKDIVNANINALLDKAEDPEKMLKLMMQEMEDTLIELKSGCAARMASKIRLEKKIGEQEALVGRWQGRARLAVEKGRDDLAREALAEKRRGSEALENLKAEAAQYDAMIRESREEIDQLEQKYQQARQKLRVLQEKARAAEASGEAGRAMGASAGRHFDAMEDRINYMMSENELNKRAKSADEAFRDMEEAGEIERELEELKRGMSK